MTSDDAVRAYFAACSDGRPERFAELVSPDYVDYGHTPTGHGPQGARDDYEHAVQVTSGLIRYDMEALVAAEDTVAVVWIGHLANGSDYGGLRLDRVVDGRIAEVRQASIGPAPD